jgi:uncharacterized protein YjiS (DUF1127 family)
MQRCVDVPPLCPPIGPTRRKGIAGAIMHLISVLEIALEVRRERRMLLGMDDRALKDIGFNRGDAYAESRRSLWDIPPDRL